MTPQTLQDARETKVWRSSSEPPETTNLRAGSLEQHITYLCFFCPQFGRLGVRHAQVRGPNQEEARAGTCESTNHCYSHVNTEDRGKGKRETPEGRRPILAI